MNTTLNTENEIHSLARVDYRETQAEKFRPSAREIWKAASREIRLQAARAERPFAKRARKAGRLANRNAWRMLHAIREELAPRLRALRGLDYLEA